jgi:hypothetical protein
MVANSGEQVYGGGRGTGIQHSPPENSYLTGFFAPASHASPCPSGCAATLDGQADRGGDWPSRQLFDVVCSRRRQPADDAKIVSVMSGLAPSGHAIHTA